MIKVGKVSSIDSNALTAKVVFVNNVVSYDLHVIQHKDMDGVGFYMPKVGDSVVCLLLPSGIEGFITGAFKPKEGVS